MTENLVASLNDLNDTVDLLIGALTESLQEQIQTAVPNATTYISGLEWLYGENANKDDTAIGRLLLTDRSTILVSSITRRVMAHGLLTIRDPGR